MDAEGNTSWKKSSSAAEKGLSGTVKVEGAKNAVLPVIAASLLASDGKSVIRNVPTLSDVYTINEVLRHLECRSGI